MMKKQLKIALFSLLLSQNIFAVEQATTLAIKNMTCALCPITVRKSLEAVKGVIKASISFEEKTADVVYDNAQTDIEALIQATTNAGYPSTLIIKKTKVR